MTELEEIVNKLVDGRVAEIKRMMVPHHCFTCLHFVMREEKPHNRVCRCPDELDATPGGVCKNWVVQPDSSQWVVNKNMSV